MAKGLRALLGLSALVLAVALMAGCCTCGSGADGSGRSASGPQQVQVGGSIQTRANYYSGGRR